MNEMNGYVENRAEKIMKTEKQCDMHSTANHKQQQQQKQIDINAIIYCKLNSISLIKHIPNTTN